MVLKAMIGKRLPETSNKLVNFDCVWPALLDEVTYHLVP